MRGLNAALKSLAMHGNCSPSVVEIVEEARRMMSLRLRSHRGGDPKPFTSYNCAGNNLEVACFLACDLYEDQAGVMTFRIGDIVENAENDGRRPDWIYGVVKGFYLAYGVGTADYHCLRIQTGKGLTDVSWGRVSRGEVRLANLPPELVNLAAACRAPAECPFAKGGRP